MKLINVIQFFVLVSCTGVWGNHIPSEDKNESDGVELIREKRDNFIDRIMNSIPFLHMSSPPNVLDEEQIDQLDEDDNDDEDDDDDDQLMSSINSIPITPSTTAGLRDMPSHIATKATVQISSTSASTVLSATIPHTPTPYSKHSSVSVSMSIEDSVSISTTSGVTVATASMIKTTPAQTSTIMVTPSISDSDSPSPDSFMNSPFTNSGETILNTSLYTYPLSASRVSAMSVSSVMPSSFSKMAATPLASKEDSEPVIKMMIMSGESPMRVQEYGGSLADERGYADNIGKQQVGEDIDVKNIRFMYASVLVPVMSGLVGALVITFGILVYKCMKRKKLKRVRYYGAKPSSGLYRLDQIGLLSDISSDEE